MSFFDIFRSKKPSPVSDNGIWIEVAGKLAGMLWTLINEHPSVLSNVNARVALLEDWNPVITASAVATNKFGHMEVVATVMLRENEEALILWVNTLKDLGGSQFAVFETEQYAKLLTNMLRNQVEGLSTGI